MKMGYILILIGVVFIGWGVIKLKGQSNENSSTQTLTDVSNSTPNEADTAIPEDSDSEKGEMELQEANHVVSNNPVSGTDPGAAAQIASSTNEEKTSKEKGNDFEAYMADILKGSKIRIKEWNQGTITDNGAMGENALNPDFFVEQKYGDNGKVEYWIECKWRAKIAQEFSLEEYQTTRYRKIQRESKRKIILAIGIGGTPDAPKSVYFVPLNNLTGNSISREEMKKFYLSNPHRDFRNRIDRYFREEVFR